MQHPDVADVHWFLGKSSPTFYYNVIGKRENAPNYAQGLVQLRPGVRRNGQRVNTVQVFIKAGALPALVQGEFEKRLKASPFQLPPGYSYQFGGEAEERSESIANLLSTVGVLGVLMVSTLVLTFNSFALAAMNVGMALALLADKKAHYLIK